MIVLHVLKNKGLLYCFINLLLIIMFTLLYAIFDHLDDRKVDDPLIYWLYFSSITQTTVGYGGLELDSHKNKTYLSLNNIYLKITIILQLFSIIFVNAYFITI